jgi:hypothetical protein
MIGAVQIAPMEPRRCFREKAGTGLDSLFMGTDCFQFDPFAPIFDRLEHLTEYSAVKWLQFVGGAGTDEHEMNTHFFGLPLIEPIR